MENSSINKKDNIVIIGAGIPGIFSALYLSNLFPRKSIHIIESSSKIGGLYNSIFDPIGGTFDKGMHIIYETCIEEIDDLIRNSMPDNEWIFLEGNSKDIAGVYHNGILEKDSPYMHINSVGKRRLNTCQSELFKSLENQSPTLEDCNNAFEFYEKRFGFSTTKYLIEPVIKKLWNMPLKKLHPASTRIVLMDRLRMFSKNATLDLMKSELIRSRIAFPNQMELDLKFRNSQRGLYPKNFGMSHLISSLEKKLNEAGVIIHKGSEMISIHEKDDYINSIKFKKNSKYQIINDIHLLHSTVSSSKLLRLFDLKVDNVSYDKNLKQSYTFMLLKEPPNMNNLYYYFCFQKNMKTYRVTDYTAYCPSAKRNLKSLYEGDLWPICVELHYKNKGPKKEKIVKDATEELLLTKVIKSKKQVIFSRVEPAGGFPVLSIKNCKLIESSNEKLNDLNIKNLLLAGQSPEKGIFFLHDILKNIYELINNFIN